MNDPTQAHETQEIGSLFYEGSVFPTIWWQNMDFDGMDIQGYLLTNVSSSLSWQRPCCVVGRLVNFLVF